MIDLLDLHKFFILKHINKGDTAVDFTMGNGHDTEFLCNSVGENGHVYAFDIQQSAIESTKARLEAECQFHNYTLIHDSHHKLKDYVKEPIKVGMFNLGYLPGGDKHITTMRETTMPAIKAGIEMLAPDGIINIAIYPGHAEGEAEGKMVSEYLSTLDRHQLCVTKINILNSKTSPYFIMVESK